MNLSTYSKRLTLFLLAAFSFVLSFAQQKTFDPAEFLKKENASKTIVTDETNTLTSDQKNALEAKLVQLDDSTSTQVAVIIIPTTGGVNISEYNQELGRNWGVGDKRYNNGVILLIAKEDRKLDIAAGYGVEGALTDYTSQHIIDDIIVPNFKNGNDYYRGIDEGTDAIIKAVKGEYNAPREKQGGKMSIGRIIFIIVIIIVFLAFSSGGGGGGGTFMSRRGSRGITGPIFWPTGGGGGWSGGGGGSSGGFGGFGGGSFGGGGASGSW
ncbi:MAG: TPM domain-containing protein [Rhizobacter sp.]|nr:TPM domain-containing protein [Ferruginibacter sp.]